MKLEHFNEIKGIIILALSLILLASLVSFNSQDVSWYTSKPNLHPQNWIGPFGAFVAGVFYFLVGVSSYFLVAIGLFWSWNKFTSREICFNFFKFLSLVMLFIVTSSLLSLMGDQSASQRFLRGGLVGIVSGNFLQSYFSPTGAFIILFAFGALSLVITGEFLVSPFFVWLFRLATSGTIGVFSKVQGAANLKPLVTAQGTVVKNRKTSLDDDNDEEEDEEEKKAAAKPQKEIKVTAPIPVIPKPELKTQAPNIHIIAPPDLPKPQVGKPKIVGEYHLPSLDLLNDAPIIVSGKVQDDLKQGAKILEETLSDFGISVKVADIERGPVITRYELLPAPGVKVGSIINLSDDLALALRAPAVRIVAPIPGKNRVGIEVPNGSSAAVYLKDVLVQSEYRTTTSKLMLAIGKDISGKPLIADLTEMPHLLVAGTTGSGKTVCLNSLIMSLLFSFSPSELKMIMVDPKMVEMTSYNDLPHLICPVVTDAKKATAALNWVVGEMESRYRIFSKEQVRNIKGYHAKGLQMPYIVVIVDELADLMQVAAKSVEGSIARIAQLARAAGIHLILATQRPSVNVITGVIKANFPSRISFKVASQIDSRTVLDVKGSESLLGKGDLLFIKPGDNKPIRGQCCYVSDEEINRVIEHIKKQATPEYNEGVLKPQAAATSGNGADEDEMYGEAVRVVIETNQASVSVLQRRLRLGYSRAARLIDIMEQNGIVGPYVGSKARDILVDREKWLTENM
ncbi:MAG: DNA translocase FtsK, partial [Candidatus Omnitrophica bacterium]|nr:DNA translocase FtsK [Candidatus Omnitrophota bacterium]